MCRYRHNGLFLFGKCRRGILHIMSAPVYPLQLIGIPAFGIPYAERRKDPELVACPLYGLYKNKVRRSSGLRDYHPQFLRLQICFTAYGKKIDKA